MSISLLSSSSQLTRFHPRLRPALSSHCGTLAELVTRSIHRDVSVIPYRVLLKSYVEFRSRIKKELTRWETHDLIKAAEMAMLLSKNDSSVFASARAADDNARRILAIDHIVNAADSEIDAVLLGSIFPHRWLQVRSPFGPQQQAVPLNLYVGFDEQRKSLLMPIVDADGDPSASLKANRQGNDNGYGGRIIGQLDNPTVTRLTDGHNIVPELAPLTCVVSADIHTNTEFIRFVRQTATSSAISSANYQAGGLQSKKQRCFPFIVPFTTLHHLGSEVRSGKEGLTNATNNTAATTKLALEAAAQLSVSDNSPAEVLRSLLYENLISTARDVSYTVDEVSGALSPFSKRVLWTVLPPTTEFGLLCGFKRPQQSAGVESVSNVSPSVPSDMLAAIISDASLRAMYFAHTLPNLFPQNSETGHSSKKQTKHQVGIITTLRSRSVSQSLDFTQPLRKDMAVGLLSPASLEAILAGSVPLVETSSHSGDLKDILIDNSLSTSERKGETVHKNVSERCGALGRKLQGR